MRCDRARADLSARIDGEAVEGRGTDLDDHLAGCAGCRAWEAAARDLTMAVRVAPAPAIPDQTAAILVAAGRAARGRPVTGATHLRLGLAVVALLQIGVALSGAFFGADTASSLHVAHELAAWEGALAAGFLYAAWRPDRAWGMVPLVAAFVLCLVGTTAFDATAGNTPVAGETVHALELAGLGLLWALGRWHPAVGAGPITAR